MRLSAVLRREGSFCSSWCPELDIASQGQTEEEALANLKEAVELYLEDEDAVVPAASVSVRTFEVANGAPAGSVGS